jgi:hypothetical protein
VIRGFTRAPALAAAVLLAGCDALAFTPPISQPGTLTQPFAVSNFFTPSGYMGDGARLGQLQADVANDACMARPAGAVGDCYRFVYYPSDSLWAGVYWVYPANNWGSRAGRLVAGGQFKRVRLQAASATPDLLINFLVGGINDPILPNRDRVSASTSVRLGTEWQEITLDVSGQDFDHVIGALAWSLPYPMDWDGEQPVVFYLDDVIWDTDDGSLAGAATP